MKNGQAFYGAFAPSKMPLAIFPAPTYFPIFLYLKVLRYYFDIGIIILVRCCYRPLLSQIASLPAMTSTLQDAGAEKPPMPSDYYRGKGAAFTTHTIHLSNTLPIFVMFKLGILTIDFCLMVKLSLPI